MTLEIATATDMSQFRSALCRNSLPALTLTVEPAMQLADISSPKSAVLELQPAANAAEARRLQA